MGLKETIVEAEDRPVEKVAVPEWKTDVYLRTMSGTERDSFEIELYGEQGNRANTRAKLLVRCMSDEFGNRIFGDKESDILGGKSAAVLDRLFDVAKRLNGIGKQDVQALEKK